MSPQMKVSLNQWLLVCVSAIFGFWGCYQVLQYRVGEIEERLCTKIQDDKVGNEKIWIRFEEDRRERITNQNSIRDIKHSTDMIQKDLQIIIKKLN